MKNIIAVTVIGVLFLACKSDGNSSQKTAYIDTEKLMKEYTAAQDIEAKYKEKGKEMGRELDAEIDKFKTEAESFKANAQANGMEWAQKKGAELRQREQQLNMAQQALMRQLQDDSGKELDTLVKQIKTYIKEYGKKNGYDYIYGTGDAATILYAKDQYDITKDVLTALNEKYKSEGKKAEAAGTAKEIK
jgi:outer membrane protein